MTSLLSIAVLLLAIAAVLLVLARPYWALVPIALMFAMEQLLQSYFTFLQSNRALFNYLVGLLGIVALLQRMMRQEPVIRDLKNPTSFAVYSVVVMWMVAMLYAPYAAAESNSLIHNIPYMVVLLVIMPLLVLDLEECRRIFVGMMLVGMIMAVLILVNPSTSYYTGRLTLDVGMTMAGESAVGSPLPTAEMGGMVAMIAALIVPKQKQALFTLLRVGAFIFGMGLAIGSGSRGQVLASAIAGIMFYPLARRLNNPRRFILSALGLLVVMGGVYATFKLFVGEQNRERWDIGLMIRDIALRFDMCVVYLQAWIESPAHWLFGLGTNAWQGIGASSYGVDYVHNVFVEVLCEQGLVGASLFVAATVLTIRAGLTMWAIHRDDPALRSAAAIFLAICAFALFNALKQGSIASMAPFYWWLLMAKVSHHEMRAAHIVDEYGDRQETAMHFGAIESEPLSA